MHEISAQDVKNIARFVAEQMPEYLALKNALQAESQQLRQAVATVLHDWAYCDETTGQEPASPAEPVPAALAPAAHGGVVVFPLQAS